MNLLDDDGWLERTWPPGRPGYVWRRKRVPATTVSRKPQTGSDSDSMSLG